MVLPRQEKKRRDVPGEHDQKAAGRLDRCSDRSGAACSDCMVATYHNALYALRKACMLVRVSFRGGVDGEKGTRRKEVSVPSCEEIQRCRWRPHRQGSFGHPTNHTLFISILNIHGRRLRGRAASYSRTQRVITVNAYDFCAEMMAESIESSAGKFKYKRADSCRPKGCIAPNSRCRPPSLSLTISPRNTPIKMSATRQAIHPSKGFCRQWLRSGSPSSWSLW
jgi:hypothetical protein